MDWSQLEHRLRLYTAKGGKKSRRRTADRVRQLIEHAKGCGARDPSQIARKHIWEWYEQVSAPSTLRDRYYAARLLWEILERGGEVPKPHSFPARPREGGAAP